MTQSLHLIAIDAAIDIGVEMAQELQYLADSIEEDSGDAADVAYLRQVVARWESAYQIIHQEPAPPDPLYWIERLFAAHHDLLDDLDPDLDDPNYVDHATLHTTASAWLAEQCGQTRLLLDAADGTP